MVQIERLEGNNAIVYAGKSFTYRDDERIHQIDHYLKGVLTLVECYTWKTISYEEKIKTEETSAFIQLLKDDEFENRSETYKEKVIFWDPINSQLVQESKYDKNSRLIDRKFYQYDSSGRILTTEIYSSAGFKKELLTFTFEINGVNLTEPKPDNSIFFNEVGKEIQKVVYLYDNSLTKTGLAVYERITPSDDWTLSEEQIFDSEGNLISAKNHKDDIKTDYEYNEV